MRPDASRDLHDALVARGEACAMPNCYDTPAPWSLLCRACEWAASPREQQDGATYARLARRRAIEARA